MSDHLFDDARRFDLCVYQRAVARMHDAPLDLDADDFDQLGICSKQLRTAAINAQHAAQRALASSATTTAAMSTGSRSDPVTSKHRPPRMRSRRWTHKDGEALGHTVVDILKRALVERDAQIASLRERVLLLEAAVVTRDEVPR
jgi:hypothetical protein